METIEPRREGPRTEPETGPSLVQMHSVHGHVHHVQIIRKSRLHGPLCRGQEGSGQGRQQRDADVDGQEGVGGVGVAHQRRDHHHPAVDPRRRRRWR